MIDYRGAILLQLIAGYIFLAGCAAPPPFDVDNVVNATSVMSAENDACVSGVRSGRFTKAIDLTTCLVTAKQNFVKAIRLRDDTPFKAYAARMDTLAGDADAGHISYNEFQSQMLEINADFNRDIAEKYRQNAADRQMAAARLQALGAAMQQAGANMRASQGSIDCTTTRMGMFVNTHCQ